jgi:hypothetical protein
MRYNKYCKIEGCGRWRREDGHVCRKHYFMLPAVLRKLLYGSEGDLVLALTLITELDGELEDA